MPIYDLKCRACGRIRRDVLLSVKQDPLEIECPACGRKGAERLPCRAHARFYGNGFYKPNQKGD